MFSQRVPEHKLRLPTPDEALPGRSDPVPTSSTHTVLGTPIKPPFPDGMQQIIFGMGCFWGAERRFWEVPGVYTTAAGYCGGLTPNPTYEEVCSGRTGHNEVVLVVYDPDQVSLDDLLKVFWEAHDPTQGMRQGNDMGTQYRSGIYVYGPMQHAHAEASKAQFADALQEAGLNPITTEVMPAPTFYYAEAYHQQYLDKNPGGYCGLGGTGVCMPRG
ncbi:peptide-methionine (S)-S-oxide reductase MsrA [Halopseudomonas nanhaiensis]|uniref:peptide-methionine (S)-S-oxide reductase MsrA n=1 Tax=Halopseudomonas nanhaiensis TaxID=2830842 RepID=UPI001CBD321D|nr:peptide-methionine (S)-S-oxide reductase MsrA [Halopseudomonas nanhaiensis]UAW98894.1 peptide-methionine (S)-S-oxide reductase MsrA [Halopseudomonas nanhaiensis]